MIVCAVVTTRSRVTCFGNSLDVFVRREDAERFINEIRSDDPEQASYLRIEGRVLARSWLTAAPVGSATGAAQPEMTS
jgi:hypothetical protein